MIYKSYYEYLIRKAYGCGRFGVAGADADIYKGYEKARDSYSSNLSAIKMNETRTSTQDIKEMAYKFGLEEGRVVGFILGALGHVKISHELSEEQKNQIENFDLLLLTPTQEKIERVLEEAHGFVSELGL